jgi:hypothetical protein
MYNETEGKRERGSRESETKRETDSKLVVNKKNRSDLLLF